jgi:thymidylate synthase (FAD)|tara:strand:+ start:226 stop:894 length:669 start_codon:yes stop_codon:yes gene_type:complete
MQVQLTDKMGSDLTVVNSARVSYAKQSEFEDVYVEHGKFETYEKRLSAKDEKLIAYLAKHNHWSPFAHCSLQFRIKAPVFVARQLVKHQVGLSWNEVSRRYVDDAPEFFEPTEWRGRPINSKQGSDGVVETDNEYYSRYINGCKVYYHLLLNQGVAPEQARMVLPQSMMTEWYWSGTLYAFARVCNLRCKSDTQKETQDVANAIALHCSKEFPISWSHLIDK